MTPRHTLVLRRAPGDDPTADGCRDAILSVTHAGVAPVVVGSATMTGGGLLIGRTTKRLRFDIDCVGLRRTAATTSYSQSVGVFHRLVDHILTGPEGSTLWIWRAFESGGDTNGPLRRDDYDRDDPDADAATSMTLWNLRDVAYQDLGETYPYDPPGILPYQVALVDEVAPSHEGGGAYSLSFALWGASTYTTALT